MLFLILKLNIPNGALNNTNLKSASFSLQTFSIFVHEDLRLSRAKFITQRLDDLHSSGDQAFLHYQIDNHNAESTAEAYYIMSNCYKLIRGMDLKHSTEFSKVAAFSAITIAELCPLRPKTPHLDSDVEHQIVNLKFGLRLAFQRIGLNNLNNDMTFEEYDRILKALKPVRFKCLEQYYQDSKSGSHALGQEYEIGFSSEELVFIDDKISIFHGYGRYIEEKSKQQI